MPRKNAEEYPADEEKEFSYHAVVSHTGRPQENWQALHDLTNDFQDSQPLFSYVDQLRGRLDDLHKDTNWTPEQQDLITEAGANVQDVWNNLYWTKRSGLDGADWLSQADFHAAGDPDYYPDVMSKEDLYRTTTAHLHRVDQIMDSL